MIGVCVHTRIHTNNDEALFLFLNESGDERVLVIVNLSAEEHNIRLEGYLYAGSYSELIEGEDTDFSGAADLRMNPWE